MEQNIKNRFEAAKEQFINLRHYAVNEDGGEKAVAFRQEFWDSISGVTAPTITVVSRMKGRMNGKIKKAFFNDDMYFSPDNIMIYREFEGKVSEDDFEYISDILGITFE